MLKATGQTIQPLRYSEPAAKALGAKGKKGEAARASRSVATVAGGMVRQTKK